MIESAVRAWRRLRLTEPVRSGNRNEVWTGELGGEQVAVRTSRRRPESLAWEFDVLARAADADVGVAAPIPADDGRRSVDGIVVQPWINGREPDTLDDWALVAETLARVHAVQVRQRPGCCAVTELAMRRRSVDADLDVLPADVADLVIGVFAKYSNAPISLIHGDPGPSNIRIDSRDRVWLLDWDESRVDVSWHDLSNLGVRVLDDHQHQRATVLSHAWEAVNAWRAEPGYARDRLTALRRLVGTSDPN